MSTSLRGSASRLTRAARAGDKVAVMKVAGICAGAGVGLWVILGWIFWVYHLNGMWIYNTGSWVCFSSAFFYILYLFVVSLPLLCHSCSSYEQRRIITALWRCRYVHHLWDVSGLNEYLFLRMCFVVVSSVFWRDRYDRLGTWIGFSIVSVYAFP